MTNSITLSKAANTMYTLAKKLGYWVVSLESNESAVQFKSLSRKTSSDWIKANKPDVVLKQEQTKGPAVWRARYT